MPQCKAVYSGNDIAVGTTYQIDLDGFCYFPPHTVLTDLLETSRMEPSTRGNKVFYNILVANSVVKDACWQYPDDKCPSHLRGHYGFSHAVSVEGTSDAAIPPLISGSGCRCIIC
eukprot:gnl/Hemi2/24025_TR8054_c0_g1_i1.p1 gnl/Hemi2/24025_TR8054_c0_g1~~gnl/Hemi2/24025_TR8054_c0_g1_i1.p1  ORF type:complete len:115 (+),score=31.07 gnl/Hemi2/24025_TR8054_c0_g1_i1:105-449(+)